MMERLYGHWAGVMAALLILWTAFASVFSLLLGYSRVPYAAAVDGDYFPVFARVHPKHQFPHVSLLALGIIVLRTTRPEFPRPFRMWLYPLPALLAFAGYVYTVVMRPKSIQSIWL